MDTDSARRSEMQKLRRQRILRSPEANEYRRKEAEYRRNLRAGQRAEKPAPPPRVYKRKLKPDQVRAVRSFANPIKVDAALYGVSYTMIQKIRAREVYKDVTDE